MLMADRAGRADVGHAHRLAAARVVGHGHHHRRNARGTDLRDRAAQGVEVDVALERMDQPGLPAFGDHQVAGLRAAILHVCARGVEVRVVQHDVTRPGDRAEQDVLGRAALVRRNHVLEPGDVAHRMLEAVERLRARVRLVGRDHAGPLAG